MKILVIFFRDEDGTSIPEYAVLLGLLVVAIGATIGTLGSNISSSLSKGSGKLIT